MADALNARIHHERIDSDAATVTVARGQKVAVDDVIISRRNDPTIRIRFGSRTAEPPASVRNGGRWRVAIIGTDNNRIACECLDDKARAVFDQNYFRERISLGYAVTVHSAQGATADTSIAVLREDTNRNLLYVAMTRGRLANHAYIYERHTEAGEVSHEGPVRPHVAQRGDHYEAATFIHGILANDRPAVIVHDYAGQAVAEALPGRVRKLRRDRTTAADHRRVSYQTWKRETRLHERNVAQTKDQHIDRSRHRSEDYGIEL